MDDRQCPAPVIKSGRKQDKDCRWFITGGLGKAILSRFAFYTSRDPTWC